MTTRHTIRLVVAVSLIAAPAAARAQAVEQRPDSALRDRAASINVGDYCSVAQQVLSARTVIHALGADSSDARTNAAIICNPLLANFSLLALTGTAPAPLRAVARVRTDVYPEAQIGVLDAMTQFRSEVRGPGVRDVARDAIGAERNADLVRISETAHSLVVVMARDRAITRLSHYERKLGPKSARLNVPEVLINYSAQRWIPGFKATPLDGPSPWELVASYVPGYITFTGRKATPIPVSAAEVGFRRYLFGENFGKAGLAGIVLPTYWAAGMLTASDQNGALVWPWKGRYQSGGYVSWGAIKVGYIKRDRGAWLLSKQFQAVPFLF